MVVRLFFVAHLLVVNIQADYFCRLLTGASIFTADYSISFFD